MSRTKKKSSPPPTPTSKKRKSASPIPPSTTELLNDWHHHLDGLAPEQKALIEQETDAARAAGGSRLAVALHLSVVRRILVGDATNPKQKKLWSAYLAANLPGFCISRAQVFKDICAAAVAEELFPAAFLNAFLTDGYALNVRPSVEEPLGKYTKPCLHALAELNSEELNEKQCQSVLTDVTATIKAEAKRNRIKPTLTIQQQRDGIYADIHNNVVSGMEKLSDAIEPGFSYTMTDFRDDLETIVGRLMTAAGFERLDVETKNLPEGFNRLNVPGSAVDSSEPDHTSEAALAATAA